MHGLLIAIDNSNGMDFEVQGSVLITMYHYSIA